MDAQKFDQVVKMIATETMKQPANTPMDHGTVGSSRDMTKREGYAYGAALYIIQRMTGVTLGTLPENWNDAQKAAAREVDELTSAAIAITGK